MCFMIMMQGFGFGDLMGQLETIGFFAYVLPFLLIFAFSYALLSLIPIFQGNRGAAAIVAFAVGFLSLQLDFVPIFFRTIFPKFGIGLAILLVALILSGVFLSQGGTGGWPRVYMGVFFGLSALIFIVIAISSLSDYTIGLGGFWDRYGALVIVGALIIGAVVAIFVASGRKKTE